MRRTFGGTLAHPSCATARTRIRRAAFYVHGEKRAGVATAVQLQGKELSYNNLNDTDAAFELVAEFDRGQGAAPSPSSSTPTRAASRSAATLAEAYIKALRCDPVSAFGGIIALNRQIDARGRRGDHQDLHRGGHRARRPAHEAQRHLRREEKLAPVDRRTDCPIPRAPGAR